MIILLNLHKDFRDVFTKVEDLLSLSKLVRL